MFQDSRGEKKSTCVVSFRVSDPHLIEEVLSYVLDVAMGVDALNSARRRVRHLFELLDDATVEWPFAPANKPSGTHGEIGCYFLID